MADFKVIETQEEFDAAIQKRLSQKEREVTGQYKDFMSPEDVEQLKASFQKQIDDVNRELATAKETAAGHDQIVADLTARATKAEAALLKNQIANENGVPFELADRLIGSTAEELKADAIKMAGYLKPKSAPPMRSTEPQAVNPSNAAWQQMLANLTTQ